MQKTAQRVAWKQVVGVRETETEGTRESSDAEDELMRLLFGKHCRPCTATSLPNRMLPTYLSDNNRL